jgi:ligand-binding sensor domain-containing protein
MEDSTQTNVVFAGTTEGLWRTTDSGHTFQRNGDPSWIINDVSIDKQDSKRVLLATDRTGVLLSTDGGLTFSPSNRGFSSRKISTVLQEGNDGKSLAIGVINDKAAGGVFRSQDGGVTWAQNSDGLGGADVLSLGKTTKGTLLAGTRHGIYRLEDKTWQASGLTLTPPVEAISQEITRSAANSGRGNRTAAKRASAPARSRSLESRKAHAPATGPQQLTAAVYALASNAANVIAATEGGLLTSEDDGRTWHHVRTAAATAWRQVVAGGSLVVVADVRSIEVSVDRGASFHPVAAPSGLTLISALTLDNTGRVWIGGREGVYASEDQGSTWHPQTNLFVPDVSGLYFDGISSRLLVTSNQPGSLIFGVHIPEMTVQHWESGWVLREVRPVGEHLLGITRYDGVVLQPETRTSEVSSR